ncbi:hypothetical protein FQA39_LY16318 [Lamprigera yunnana]|nr:hypothetical protein FQA39_LY16318 [Lamprigera yunnana]
MNHPFIFGVVIAIAIGTAVYCYLKGEAQIQRYNYIDCDPNEEPTRPSNIKKRKNSNACNGDNCAICFCSMKFKKVLQLSCKHKFHEHCIKSLHIINMTHPGLTFGLMIAVALGTAIYYYFRNDVPAEGYSYSQYDLGCSSKKEEQDKRLRRKRNKEDHNNVCIICFDELRSYSSLYLPCNHIFHEDCVRKWMSTNRTCPICRSTI